MKRNTMIGLLTVLFSLLVTGARADTVKYLVLETTDKGKTEVALDKQPNISCSGGELKVTAGGEEILSTSMANVKNFYFESATTRIDETVGDKPNLQQGHVYMSNLKAGDSIYVYDADGRLAGQQTVSADGRVDVDLTTLTKGVYIVKTPATSIKIINK